jgi:hydroxymethylglutaryl-CoA reductase
MEPINESTVVTLRPVPRPRLRVLRSIPNSEPVGPASQPSTSDPTGNMAALDRVYTAPFGFVLTALVNRELRSVPLIIDDAAELAAVGQALDLVRGDGGFDASVSCVWHVEARIHLSGTDEADDAAARVRALEAELLELATAALPPGTTLTQPLALERLPSAPDALLFRLHAEARDGENLESALYDAARAIAPALGSFSGVRPSMRVRCQRVERIRVRCRIDVERLISTVLGQTAGAASSAEHAVDRAAAALGAGGRDASIAAAHNAMIESGVAAVALALGNAPGPVVASAQRHAARGACCQPLCIWRVVGGAVHGELELPVVLATHGRWRAPERRTLEDGAPLTAALDVGMLAACIGVASSVVALEDTLRVRIREESRSLPPPRRRRAGAGGNGLRERVSARV